MRILVVCVATLLALACANFQVGASHDPTADFGAYRSFAMGPVPQSSRNVAGYTEMTGRLIQDRIAARLVAVGLVSAPRQEADLLVVIGVSGKPQAKVTGGGLYEDGGLMVRNFIEGTLVINLYDERTLKLVWHGWGQKEMLSTATEPKNVVADVDEIMKQFPPDGTR